MRLKKTSSRPAYTELMRDAVLEQMRADKRVVAITAAMCQGTMLEPVRDEFPDRFFDVGICESHAVAFAAGLAKTGLRPIVAIYSTFMQRCYDQIFQEVSLQNLPVTLLLDRAGLVGPDGPTHHGVFDLTYLRPMPNLVVMAPGDAADVAPMLDWALHHDGPVAIRYPKAPAETISRGLSHFCLSENGTVPIAEPAPIELGRAEVLHWGGDGMFIACGTLLGRLQRGGQAAGGRRHRLRRDQRPIRQAARYADDSPRDPRVSVGRHGRGGHVDGRFRQRGVGGRRRGRPRRRPRSPARHPRSLHRTRPPQ